MGEEEKGEQDAKRRRSTEGGIKRKEQGGKGEKG